jgi:hypothetical protein
MESIILIAVLAGLTYYLIYHKFNLNLDAVGAKVATISGMVLRENYYSLAELWIYPIKSCRGVSMSSLSIGDRGFLYDRNWMLIDADTNKFITQREQPRVCSIRCLILVLILLDVFD